MVSPADEIVPPQRCLINIDAINKSLRKTGKAPSITRDQHRPSVIRPVGSLRGGDKSN